MNVRDFITAGNATFTVTSRKSGKRFTYRVRVNKAKPSMFFVSVLTGPDNEQDFTYAGVLTVSGKTFVYKREDGTPVPFMDLRRTKGSKVSATAPSWLGFRWLIVTLNANDGEGESRVTAQADIHHEGRCGRCGRKLTVPESIESGFGPECITRIGS